MTFQHAAYAANIVILLPIAVPTLLSLFRTDQGRFAESEGWRALVGAFWTAVMVLSLLGLFAPHRYVPVLVLQLIYKSLWLLVYALPRALQGRWRELPAGITLSFLGIVLVWPWIIPWSLLLKEA